MWQFVLLHLVASTTCWPSTDQGQGAALRKSKLVFRNDWERVITPVIDFAIRRKELDSSKIALFGYSMGRYLVARAAAFDHRPIALILDDGIMDFSVAFEHMLPPFLVSWINDHWDDDAKAVLELVMKSKTGARWAMRNGMWTFGATSSAEFVRMTLKYSLRWLAGDIKAATLVLDAENDMFLKGQPQAAHVATG